MNSSFYATADVLYTSAVTNHNTMELIAMQNNNTPVENIQTTCTWVTNAPVREAVTDEYIRFLNHSSESYWKWRAQFIEGPPKQIKPDTNLSDMVGLYKRSD